MSRRCTCSFCGRLEEGWEVAEGPADVYICLTCAREAKRIVAMMNKEYQCSFCGEMRAGHLVAEGPGEIHICIECIEKVPVVLGKRT